MQCELKALHKGALNVKTPSALSTLYLPTAPASSQIFHFSYVFHFSCIASSTVVTTEDTDQFGSQQVVYEKTWEKI